MDVRPNNTTFGFKWFLIYIVLTGLTAVAIFGNITTGPQTLEANGFHKITYHKFDSLLNISQLSRVLMLWISPIIFLIYLILLAVKRGQGFGRGAIWISVTVAFAVACQIALAILIKAHPKIALAGSSAHASKEPNNKHYMESKGGPSAEKSFNSLPEGPETPKAWLQHSIPTVGEISTPPDWELGEPGLGNSVWVAIPPFESSGNVVLRAFDWSTPVNFRNETEESFRAGFLSSAPFYKEINFDRFDNNAVWCGMPGLKIRYRTAGVSTYEGVIFQTVKDGKMIVFQSEFKSEPPLTEIHYTVLESVAESLQTKTL